MTVGHLVVVGLGLVGGSVALAARAARAAERITGVDVLPDVRRRAVARGVVDRAVADLSCLADADLVVLAAPPRSVVAMADEVAASVRAGALVTDVASVKRVVVARYAKALRGRAAYVGGHPLAGSERSGLDVAHADLFRGATWFLTPAGDAEALDALATWVARLGARPLVVAAELHDALLAATSHLPQVAASALSRAAAGRCAEAAAEGAAWRDLVGPGFRDATRLAASAPDLWVDILLANADNILDAVNWYLSELEALRRLLAARDAEGLRAWFGAAVAARRSFVPPKEKDVER